MSFFRDLLQGEAMKSQGSPVAVEDALFKFFHRHRLEDVGGMLLECAKPVSFIGQQMLIMGEPVLSPVMTGGAVKDWQVFLSDRRHIERLIRRLDEVKP